MAQAERKLFEKSSPELPEELMNRVGLAVFNKIDQEAIFRNKKILLLCGPGNNGGDAYVVATLMLNNYKPICIQWGSIEKSSPLCQKKRQAFTKAGGKVVSCDEIEANHFCLEAALIIDGLFGTGLKKPIIKSKLGELIKAMNQRNTPIYAIDIPSGICGDQGVLDLDNSRYIIKARKTFAIEMIKWGQLLPQALPYSGTIRTVRFNIDKSWCQDIGTVATLMTRKLARKMLPPLDTFRHKYTAGSVGAWVGSEYMMGAAALSIKACYRSGAGYVKFYNKKSLSHQLIKLPLEAVADLWNEEEVGLNKKSKVGIERILQSFNKHHSLLIGPGLSLAEEVYELFRALLPQIENPVLIDGDGITFFAKDLRELPENSVLTPHLGELKRLLQGFTDKSFSEANSIDGSLIDESKKLARFTNATILLKGMPTYIISPEGEVNVSKFGNPGMATAGSGDVLSGIITALMAQGLSGFSAASLGAVLHGLSGDLAAKSQSPWGVMASDLVENIGRGMRLVFLSERGKSTSS